MQPTRPVYWHITHRVPPTLTHFKLQIYALMWEFPRPSLFTICTQLGNFHELNLNNRCLHTCRIYIQYKKCIHCAPSIKILCLLTWPILLLYQLYFLLIGHSNWVMPCMGCLPHHIMHANSELQLGVNSDLEKILI